jgi:hypothetical protein
VEIKNKKMTVKKLFEIVEKEGWYEYRDGAYLNTRESIIADQKDWDGRDGTKKMDFSGYPYWITGSPPTPETALYR